MSKKFKWVIGTIILWLLTTSLFAQIKENDNFIDSLSSNIQTIKEELQHIQDNYYVIIPSGIAGNIGVFIGDGGIILIDSQWSELTGKIKELLLTVTQKPIIKIINTHYHFDHTNGNISFGAQNIPILSHENARMRMSKKQVLSVIGTGMFKLVQKPYPPDALPTITFTDEVILYEGTEIIELTYSINAHTDGDIIVHFKNADIYHTGDIFVTYGFPFIDEENGGDIYFMIDALEQLLLQSTEKTRFIPGHGPVCSKKELQEYKEFLAIIRDNVEMLTRENRTIDEIIKDTKVKIHSESLDADEFIKRVYRSVRIHLGV